MDERNTKTKIKICGIRRDVDVEYVNESKPDYVGFVFANSKRKVTRDEAVSLREKLSDGIIAVGVFVNEEIDIVAGLLNDNIIDIAQLHGDEDDLYIKSLRKNMNRGQIMKAIRVLNGNDIEESKKVDVDYILFDTFKAGTYGGTGESFDWKLLKDYDRPFFLAGGIDENNVNTAIELTAPFAVDISSAVETGGYKDKDKINKFINTVRNV